MPIHYDDERRFMEVSVDVTGTPEEVWQAIATGPGISSWFTPTEVEERIDGRVAFHLSEDMVSRGRITAWEPPHRFGYVEPDWSGDAPPLATEHIVETRGGGQCTVRFVSSLFTTRDEWDDQLESMEGGWSVFFEVLRLRLERFRGQPCTAFYAMRETPTPSDEAWLRLANGLNLASPVANAVWTTRAPSPAVSGTIHSAMERGNLHRIIALLEAPAPGIAVIVCDRYGESTFASVGMFLFGPTAETGQEHQWRAWMAEVFPA